MRLSAIFFICAFTRAASDIGPDGEEYEAPDNIECPRIPPSTSTKALRKRMNEHEPLIVDFSSVFGSLIKNHWDLFEDDDCFNMAISKTGAWYGLEKDPKSAIGLKRVLPAVMECVTWTRLKDTFTYLHGRDYDISTEMPESLETVKVKNFNDPEDEGYLKLSDILHSHGDDRRHYIAGEQHRALDEAIGLAEPRKRKKGKEMPKHVARKQALLRNVSNRLAEIMQKQPLSARFWASPGMNKEKYHLVPSDRWLCQFAARRQLRLLSPQFTKEGMYPVRFTEKKGGKEYQHVLTKENRWKEIPIPVKYRDQNFQGSAVDSDQYDRERFKDHTKTWTMNCDMEVGDCAWLPSYWWMSSDQPPEDDSINMGVSFSFGAKSLKYSKFNDTKAAGFDLEGAVWTTHKMLRKGGSHSEL